MAAAYPHKWVPALGDSPQYPATLASGEPHPKAGQLTVAGDTWARGLAGLSAEQFGRGLESCINSGKEWPPTLTEFKMRALDIPSFADVAADSARKDAKRMPFTIAVFSRVYSWSYRHAPEIVAEKMLRRAYDDTVEAVMNGAPLPEPLREIEQAEQEKPKRTPEVARAAMTEIAALLRGEAETKTP